MPYLKHRPEIQALLRAALLWDNQGCLPMRADLSSLPQLKRYA